MTVEDEWERDDSAVNFIMEVDSEYRQTILENGGYQSLVEDFRVVEDMNTLFRLSVNDVLEARRWLEVAKEETEKLIAQVGREHAKPFVNSYRTE